MKIGELSQKTALSTYTIRYYEKLGLLRRPAKDSSGHRVYASRDIDLIDWITCLKKSGMSLEKIKIYAQAYHGEDKDILIGLLETHLEKLESQYSDIQHYIEVTHQKINKLKKGLT